jgi:hypothetical protein
MALEIHDGLELWRPRSFDFARALETGKYMRPMLASGDMTASMALTAGRLYTVMWPLARGVRCDRFAVYVNDAAAGKVCRLGLYRDNGSYYPGALLLDGGEVDVSTTGTKEVEVSIELDAGMYWIACLSDGAPGVRYTYQGLGLKGSSSVPRFSYAGYRKDIGYGALPDPFPAGGEDQDLWLALGMRYAALL